ncbi:MAG: hypothetical protein FJW68_07965 [Actinobacteria bacterium]|nr:hypothetical protein [Actinomycetota bacterium]
MRINNKIISLFSIIIIFFGLAGCVPCFGGIYYASKISIKNPGSSDLLNTVNGSIKSINILLDDSSAALNNVAGTVQEAQYSLADASGMLKSSSLALSEVSGLIEFDILGFKPLAGMSAYFKTMSEDAQKLSASLFGMSQSIGTNIGDINKISGDVGKISADLEVFSVSFSTTADSIPDFNLKWFFYIVFIYLGILNIIFILIGISLLSMSRQKAFVQ